MGLYLGGLKSGILQYFLENESRGQGPWALVYVLAIGCSEIFANFFISNFFNNEACFLGSKLFNFYCVGKKNALQRNFLDYRCVCGLKIIFMQIGSATDHMEKKTYSAIGIVVDENVPANGPF